MFKKKRLQSKRYLSASRDLDIMYGPIATPLTYSYQIFGPGSQKRESGNSLLKIFGSRRKGRLDEFHGHIRLWGCEKLWNIGSPHWVLSKKNLGRWAEKVLITVCKLRMPVSNFQTCECAKGSVVRCMKKKFLVVMCHIIFLLVQHTPYYQKVHMLEIMNVARSNFEKTLSWQHAARRGASFKA